MHTHDFRLEKFTRFAHYVVRRAFRVSFLRFVIYLFIACADLGYAQSQTHTYLDPKLPPEQRAADLVKQMTSEEKASQLVNQARAIPRLGIPAYDWWSGSLHGVMRDGTTEFPELVGLGATFDTDAIHQMAIVLATEGRIKHEQALGGHRSAGGSNETAFG